MAPKVVEDGRSKAAFLILLLLLVAVPLVFSPLNTSPLVVKNALFQIGVIIGGALWLSSGWRRVRSVVAGDPLRLPVALLVGWWIVTVLTSGHRDSAFAGLLTALSFVAWYYLLLYTFTSRRRIELAITAILATAIPMCAYGFIQRYGLDPIPWTGAPEGRIILTLGNATHVAAFLAFVIPLAVGRFAATRVKAAALVPLAVVALAIPCLIWTYTRAGWVGLIAASPIYVLSMALYTSGGNRSKMMSLTRHPELDSGSPEMLKRVQHDVVLTKNEQLPSGVTRKKAVKRLAALLVLVALVLAFPSLVSLVKTRIVSAVDPHEPANVQRIAIWRVAASIWRDHKVFGTGVGTFGTYFPSYATAEYYATGTQVYCRHAHNEFLQVATETGAVGLGLFLLFLGYFLREGLRAVKRGGNGANLAGALLWGTGALLICNLFGLTMRVTFGAMLFWFAAAATASIGSTAEGDACPAVPKSSPAKHANVPTANSKRRALPPRIALHAAVVFCALGGCWMALKPVLSDHHLKMGNVCLARGLQQESLQQYEEAARIQSSNVQAWYKAGGVLLKLGDPEAALKKYQAVQRICPEFARVRYNLGIACLGIGDAEAAVKHLEIAVRLKSLPSSRYELGRAYTLCGRRKEAMPELCAAIEKDFMLAKDHLWYRTPFDVVKEVRRARVKSGGECATTCSVMASAFVRQRRFTEAARELETAAKYLPNPMAIQTKLGAIYGAGGNLKKAVEAFLRPLAINPNDWETRANLGYAYERQGKFDQAAEQYRMILASQDDPNTSRVTRYAAYRLVVLYSKPGG